MTLETLWLLLKYYSTSHAQAVVLHSPNPVFWMQNTLMATVKLHVDLEHFGSLK